MQTKPPAEKIPALTGCTHNGGLRALSRLGSEACKHVSRRAATRRTQIRHGRDTNRHTGPSLGRNLHSASIEDQEKVPDALDPAGGISNSGEWQIVAAPLSPMALSLRVEALQERPEVLVVAIG